MWFWRIYQESWHIAQPPVHHSYVLSKLNSSFSDIVLSSLVYPHSEFDIEQDGMHKPLNWEGASIRSFTVRQVMPIYTIYCCSLQTCSIWVTNFLFSLSRHSDQQFYSFQPQFPLDKMKWDTLEPPLIGHPWNTSKQPLNGGWLLNTINEHTVKFWK